MPTDHHQSPGNNGLLCKGIIYDELGYSISAFLFLIFQEIGPRALNYDVLNTHLVYLYGNQSAVLFALGHMTGFSAKETKYKD